MDTELSFFVEAWEEASRNTTAAAKRLGITRSKMRRRLAAAGAAGLINCPRESTPGFGIKGKSTLYGADGEVKQTWVKEFKEGESFEDMAEAIRDGIGDAIKGKSGKTKVYAKPHKDLLTVIPIADQHVGVGGAAGDGDLSQSRETLLASLGDLFSMTRPSEKCILLNLGDYFHINDSTNRTPASGHDLDVCATYYETVKAGTRMMIEAAKLALKSHEKVEVITIKGNHDPDAACGLAAALDLFFEDEPRLTVSEPLDIWYHLYGDTLLGAAHGHLLKKPVTMSQAMAAHQAESWGRSKHRYFLSGHIHHETVQESGGGRL